MIAGNTVYDLECLRCGRHWFSIYYTSSPVCIYCHNGETKETPFAEDYDFKISEREKKIHAKKSRCRICRGNGYDRHGKPCRECSRL